MRLTQAQLVGIAPRVLPGPCKCGGGTHRIEPELRDLGDVGLVVTVMCHGCGHFDMFSAAALGLVPAPADWNVPPAATPDKSGN